MLITEFHNFCEKTFGCHSDKIKREHTKASDFIAATTILVLGILATMTKIVAFSYAASWFLLGAGSIYAATMYLHCCHRRC